MDDDNHQPPSLTALLGRIGRTALGTVRNRAELLSVEWQEEKARLSHLLIVSLGLVLVGVLAIGLLTATIIVLIPSDYRIYALGVFTLLYAGGCVWMWIALKALLKRAPFRESIEQLRKDSNWIEDRDE